jgi:hypothetical protein
MGNDVFKTYNVMEEYKKSGLPTLQPSEYESDFELQAFMSLNIIRNDPKAFIKHIEAIKSKLPETCLFINRPRRLLGDHIV